MRLTYTPQEAAQILGLDQNQLHQLHKTGQLQTIKIGKRQLITHTDLHHYINQNTAAA